MLVGEVSVNTVVRMQMTMLVSWAAWCQHGRQFIKLCISVALVGAIVMAEKMEKLI